jgi:hypothetical protein
MEGQVVHATRLAGRTKPKSLDGQTCTVDAGIGRLNKEPMKPGNGGKENKPLFFLDSWLPYC